jgi:hypothetical protein
MKEKQLTAVEYIKEKLMCDEYWYENMTFDQIFEKARSMEKKQMVDMYQKGIENYGYIPKQQG